MAVPAMVVALAEQWDRVNSTLGDVARHRLHDLVVRLADADEADDRSELRAEIAELLFAELDPDDPVVQIGNRLGVPLPAGEQNELAQATTTVRLRLAAQIPWSPYHRILAAGCVDATVLRSRGVDPDIPNLIRLDRDDGSIAVPLFQLLDDGQPADFVLRINEVLGVQRDPWGVADWWLSVNTWLHEAPVRFLPRPSRDSLMAAAVAAMEG